MKRVQFFCVAAVLLLTGTVSADLVVKEMAPGQKVILDTNTGRYWYRDRMDFMPMTYDEQLTAIANLDYLGNDDWYMAGLSQMEEIWNNYTGDEIIMAFIVPNTAGWPEWLGRYDVVSPTAPEPSHYVTNLAYWFSGGAEKWPLGMFSLPDWVAEPYNPHTWVTTDAAVVPVPPAVILAASGLLTSALGLNRLRRKH